ncbi:histidine kinase [Amycolatopsis sp. NPDC059027]|uniref:sensor histidine kinase n=1 Tax=Amycolatopsis sp. NPDC059027 TaxID=3346709 RepID=UPI003670BE17
MTHYVRSVGRAFALAGFALVSWLDVLAELLAFGLLCTGLIFFYAPALLWARRRSAKTRELVARWCGVEVESPYRPEPPEPAPERDGWYRDGNQLYKRAWWLRWMRRFHWATDDPATRRELGWQLVNPLAALALPVATMLCGPRALRWYGRWTRHWLGPRADGEPDIGVTRRVLRWVGRRYESLGHQMGLFVLAVVQLGFTVWPIVLLVGAYPVAAPIVLLSRTVTNTLRREAWNWTGVRIDRPYLPAPSLPVPRPDGLFQVGKQLYEEPWEPVRLARTRWVTRDRATWRDLASGLLNVPVFLVLMIPTVSATFWGFLGLQALWIWRPIAQGANSVWSTDWFTMIGLPSATTTLDALKLTPVALGFMVAGLIPATWLARQQARFARLLLGPTESSRLAQRVERLKETRTDASVAQAAELRRIERDLHDGVQARLVAMGMKLGAVEALIDADPGQAKKLAAEVREASSEALTELRLLVRGIHPPVLSERGLVDAVRALALDSPLDAEVTGSLAGRLEKPEEACAYFAVSELLGNAAKHGEARTVSISLEHLDGLLRIVVTDDGKGGAEPARGSGIRGIERRLGVFDGRFSLTSPIGGPTTATVEIPCQLDLEQS